MEQLGIAIAMELIYMRHPCSERVGYGFAPSRVATWMHMTAHPKNMDRSLEQVHYKMYGTLH